MLGLANPENARIGIGEIRGSGLNQGYSNIGAWNPRIVGINIWVTGDNSGDYSDPLWLAEVPFATDSQAISCDNKKSDDTWDVNVQSIGCAHQIIKAIKTIPTLRYSLSSIGIISEYNRGYFLFILTPFFSGYGIKSSSFK